MQLLQSERLHALDWVRALTVIAVFVFHSGAAYAAGDWHINNSEKSTVITVVNSFLLLWIMPVLFVISGASTYFAMKSQKPSSFFRDRLVLDHNDLMVVS
jgi:peptidoglycan/LPS O-acetylase OafA/YrhL